KVRHPASAAAGWTALPGLLASAGARDQALSTRGTCPSQRRRASGPAPTPSPPKGRLLRGPVGARLPELFLQPVEQLLLAAKGVDNLGVAQTRLAGHRLERQALAPALQLPSRLQRPLGRFLLGQASRCRLGV